MHPIFTRRFNKSLLLQLQKIALNYDILYFDFSQVAIYSLYIQHPYKVLRLHDVLAQKFSRKNFIIGKWVIYTEEKIVHSVQKIFVPSKKDADLIHSLYGKPASYTNEYLKSIVFPANIEQRKQFVFYGYWKRSENTEGLIWFIERVMPRLDGNFEFLVIGGGLDDTTKAKYLDTHGIRYMGFIENPLAIIMQSAALICPLFQGAGVKVKVIDSFTTGTPVIGTDLAFEGLPNIQELSYVAQSADEFFKVIKKFIPFSYIQKKELARKFDMLYNKHHLLEQL